MTGNLSNVLYALVLAAGGRGLRSSQWRLFYATVFFAGLMKPPFLTFLLIPLLVADQQWRQCAGTIFAVVAGDLVQGVSMPKYWHEFQQNVYARVFLYGDSGFGLLGQFVMFRSSTPLLRRLAPSTDVALVLGPLLLLLVMLRRRRLGQVAERLWVPCLVVFAVLSNPRLLSYDAGVALVPAVYIAVEFCRSLPTGPWRGLQIGLPLTVLVGLEATKPNTALCLLLVLSVVLVLVLLLWPAYFVFSARRPAGACCDRLAHGRDRVDLFCGGHGFEDVVHAGGDAGDAFEAGVLFSIVVVDADDLVVAGIGGDQIDGRTVGASVLDGGTQQ